MAIGSTIKFLKQQPQRGNNMTYSETLETLKNNSDLDIADLVAISGLSSAEVITAIKGSPMGDYLISKTKES